MYELKVKSHFDAAHFIKGYPGKCARMHGHRWEVEVVLEGSELGELNMLIDFGVIKQAMKEIIDGNLDHWNLNKTLDEPCVTAEYIAKFFFEEIVRKMDEVVNEPASVRVVRTCIWESPDCGVVYYE